MVRSAKSPFPIRSEAPRTRRRFGPRDLPSLMATTPAGPTPQIKVLLAGKLTAMTAPGGGETQLVAMARSLPGVGVQARLWRPWEDTLSQYDCLHLMGSVPGHLEVVDAAHRQRIPVVLSTIAWFDFANIWREPLPLWVQLIASGRFLARAMCPKLPSWRRKLYQAVDLLLPNSHAEAEQLQRYFRVPHEKIHVVPNGADERFAHARPQAFSRLVGGRDFILYAGRIEPRKNQLNFLRAMRGVDAPIVVLGDVVPGHEAYHEACRREAGENVRFIGGIRHDDPLLASAYAACGCLVLASWFETPGLVALEAAMQGVPLVLPARGCAREYFGEWAEYTEPDDLRGIRFKTMAALSRPRSADLARMVRRRYTWQAAAQSTREAYEKLV
jgi:glycosyltransferase involved in cell wall biosynthesis